MLTWVAALVVVVMVTAAISVKLLVRRRAPMGGWFTDSPRSAGSLSVIGTIFAVMLGFVILLALQSYQRAGGVERRGHRRQGAPLRRWRAVIEDEWPAMREGRSSERVQSWIGELDREFAIADPQGARQEAAYAQWLDEETQRREGRRERIGEATPFVPLQLWFVLGIGASLMIAYMCAQADRREGVLIQSIPIGFVTALVTAGLLVVLFLDYPYSGETGSIMPTEMRNTLALIEHGTAAPCDERGIPRST